MPKRSRKPTSDPNLAAFAAVQALTEPDAPRQKNPAAVALGRLGGLRGGKARAAQMTAKQRKESARHAAQSRWAK